MRIDRRFVGWGIFFIILGGIPLLAQQGLVETDAIRDGSSLWPLFIVGIGLSLLLRDTALDWAGGLVVAATAGVIAGSVLATGAPFGGICGGGSSGPPRGTSATGSLADGEAVMIDQPCGDLTLTTASGTEWAFDAGQGGWPADISQDGSTVRIAGARTGRFPFDGFGDRTSWTVTVPRDPTIDLTMSLNAGQAVIDLAGAHLDAMTIEMNAGSAHVAATDLAALRSLDVGMNAGSLTIALPAIAFQGRMEANAGSLAFCIPPGTGLRVALDGNITVSNNLDDRGLTRSGDVWTRESTNGATIELVVEANAGSITLDPEEGC